MVYTPTKQQFRFPTVYEWIQIFEAKYPELKGVVKEKKKFNKDLTTKVNKL
jgi:hypothetical protein